MSRYRVTASGAPNFAYALVTRLLAAGMDISLDSVRFLLSGGEPVDATTMAGFAAAAAAYGLDPGAIVPAYGLAESTLAVTFPPRGAGVRVHRIDPGHRPFVKVGRPVPGTEIRIADAAPVGRIEVRGPSVVGHYWGEPAPPAGSWLDTGDLGYLADGELVVCGRVKDVLFAAGRNIFPQDVAAAAADVPGVRTGGVAAFGIPGRDGDRLVVAVEAPGASGEAVRRAVAQAVLGEVGLAPHAVVTLPAGRLPRTSSGKLRRAEARRLYQCGDLTPERTIR
jgi:fatty-acyl-CoA synthase